MATGGHICGQTGTNFRRTQLTRPLVEHLRQISRKSDQWPRMRCDDESVTVLNKGQLAI